MVTAQIVLSCAYRLLTCQGDGLKAAAVWVCWVITGCRSSAVGGCAGMQLRGHFHVARGGDKTVNKSQDLIAVHNRRLGRAF